MEHIGLVVSSNRWDKMIRQKKYECGNYLDIEIFNIPKGSRIVQREKKMHESSPAQKNLNNKKAERYFVRLVHLNFFKNDLYVDLTFENEHLPTTRDDVLKPLRNYIKSLQRYRKKQGLSPLKYIYVISNLDTNGNKVRYHVHMIINDMDRDVVESKWKYGYANTDRLKFNEVGVTGKSLYMIRQTKGDRSWGSSINLIKPVAKVSDKKITPSIRNRMLNNPEDREYFEKMYPGWVFTDCIIEDHNDRMTGEGLYIRMRRYDNGYIPTTKSREECSA